jgi:glucosyl-dolichyl phosphate glucuronosyltransferase
VVVDNGSTDETQEVVRRMARINTRIVYRYEKSVGKSRAYNGVLRQTRSAVVVSTDDDVRFRQGWLVAIARPIMSGEVDATQGQIKIAPQLTKPWMTQRHRSALMEIGDLSDQHARQPFLIGANMAFARHVLEKVPRFEVELGAGAMGNMEDTLFYLQLLEAGYRIKYVPEAIVEHHFDPVRLTRAAQLRSAEAHGKSSAWVKHHWAHDRDRWLLAREYLNRVRRWRRGIAWRLFGPKEGFDVDEIDYHQRATHYREQRRLAGTPHLYQRRALSREMDERVTA